MNGQFTEQQQLVSLLAGVLVGLVSDELDAVCQVRHYDGMMEIEILYHGGVHHTEHKYVKVSTYRESVEISQELQLRMAEPTDMIEGDWYFSWSATGSKTLETSYSIAGASLRIVDILKNWYKEDQFKTFVNERTSELSEPEH